MRMDNANVVLGEVEKLIENGRKMRMREVCGRLSIFDWWVDDLSISKMKQMRSFLKEAIKLGYKGKVSFKVGASGCANGMWAYKNESTDGFDPDGDCIYHSFTPQYKYWSFKKGDTWYPIEGHYDSLETKKQFEDAYKKAYFS